MHQKTKSKDELERLVESRTQALQQANSILQKEISERKKTEEILRSSQEILRSLTSQLVLAEERERQQIAMDLHDFIGQDLAYCKIKLSYLREKLQPSEFRRLMDEIFNSLNRAVKQLRAIQFDLSSPLLQQFGFEEALSYLCEEMNKKFGLIIEIMNDQLPKPLTEDTAILLFRSVRELLINVAKHAQTQKAAILLQRDADHIKIIISDSGRGFDIDQIHAQKAKLKRFGLLNIKERLKTIDGSFDIFSEPGKGTNATLTAPLSVPVSVNPSPDELRKTA